MHSRLKLFALVLLALACPSLSAKSKFRIPEVPGCHIYVAETKRDGGVAHAVYHTKDRTRAQCQKSAHQFQVNFDPWKVKQKKVSLRWKAPK